MEIDFSKHTIFARDPFAVDPLPKAHYHPSPERCLKTNERNISLSPSRRETRKKPCDNGADRLSPMDEIFLQKTNSYQTKPAEQDPDENEEDFDETWPSSERPSSLNLTGFEDDSVVDAVRYHTTLEKFTGKKSAVQDGKERRAARDRTRQPGSTANKPGVRATSKPDNGPKNKGKGSKTKDKPQPDPGREDAVDGSVLSRYIERFRNSAPMSREERARAKTENQGDFWWLKDSERPARTDTRSVQEEEEEERYGGGIPLTQDNLDKYGQQLGYRKPPDHVPPSPGDRRTLELQERAERLLERSSNSTVVSTDPAVSTEGLGSNMSDMSSLEEYTHRPKFVPYSDLGERQQVGRARPVPRLQPVSQQDDDILQKWRLRRKIEQARHAPVPPRENFNFITKTEQEKKIESKLEEFKQQLAGKDSSLPRVSTRMSGFQFTPAPKVDDVLPRAPSPERPSTEPHIASPLLHKTKPRTDRQSKDVDPHLHLMCDLLPCPHSGKYQEYLAQDKRKGAPNEGKGAKSSDEVLREDDKQSPKGDNSDENVYKKYLEAEKPDVEKSKRMQGEKIFDVPRDKISRVNVSEPEKETKAEEKFEKRDNRKPKTVRIRKNLDLSDLSEEESVASAHRSESDSDSKQLHRDIRSRPDQSTGLRERREKLPRPTGSSSPKQQRRGVDVAIGQVVKNHLFSMSTSTLLSSVESLPPTVTVEQTPQKPGSASEEKLEKDDEDCESDGEFPDDHLLQMLRNQRAQYEQQLQDIDEMLAKIEAR